MDSDSKDRADSPFRLSRTERLSLYASASNLNLGLRERCGLRIPVVTYFQDPVVAESNPDLAFDENFLVNWEPGLSDGPTSARFAIVDFNGDTGQLAVPAEWDDQQQTYVSAGERLTKGSSDLFQFHQFSVWGLVQRALEFFEEGNGLGRRIPWAFEGNRLIVVPHAGYGENAYYDRSTKSLQFYYFGEEGKTIYTCLSADIVNHEFGHAVLDGVRPYFNESTQVQTAAFHEFIGDLSAILLALRNNGLRKHLAEKTQGNIGKANELSSIAEEFGSAVSNKPYLRSALNQDNLSSLARETSPHRLSQVLTGAMFDILKRLAEHYQRDSEDTPSGESSTPAEGGKRATPAEAFWRASERLQRTAIQPLDLLPPVEVTFRDYALAVCRAQQLSTPLDPYDYYGMLIDVFRARDILSDADVELLKQPQYLYDRLRLTVHHDIGEISRSRSAAYRFLDDNREDLLIPANRDFFVSDLYDANKLTRQSAPMPRQIVLEYVWREDVPLNGPQFGKFDGQVTTMLCGGTLVFDGNGIVLSWVYKPGSLPYGGKRIRRGKVAKLWEDAVAEGSRRRQELLDNLVSQVARNRIGSIISTEKGMMGTRVPPFIAEEKDGDVHFRLSPHLHLSEEKQLNQSTEGTEWEISC